MRKTGRYMRMLCQSYAAFYRPPPEGNGSLFDAAKMRTACDSSKQSEEENRGIDQLGDFFEKELTPWLAILLHYTESKFGHVPRYNQALTCLILTEKAVEADAIREKGFATKQAKGRPIAMAQVPTGQGKTIIAALLAMLLDLYYAFISKEGRRMSAAVITPNEVLALQDYEKTTKAIYDHVHKGINEQLKTGNDASARRWELKHRLYLGDESPTSTSSEPPGTSSDDAKTWSITHTTPYFATNDMFTKRGYEDMSEDERRKADSMHKAAGRNGAGPQLDWHKDPKSYTTSIASIAIVDEIDAVLYDKIGDGVHRPEDLPRSHDITQVLSFVYDVVAIYLEAQAFDGCSEALKEIFTSTPAPGTPAADEEQLTSIIQAGVAYLLDVKNYKELLPSSVQSETSSSWKKIDSLGKPLSGIHGCLSTRTYQEEPRFPVSRWENLMKNAPPFLGCKHELEQASEILETDSEQRSGVLCVAYKALIREEVKTWVKYGLQMLHPNKLGYYTPGKEYLLSEGLCARPELQNRASSSTMFTDGEKKAMRFVLLCDLGRVGRDTMEEDLASTQAAFGKPGEVLASVRVGERFSPSGTKWTELKVPGSFHYFLKLRFGDERGQNALCDIAVAALRRWHDELEARKLAPKEETEGFVNTLTRVKNAAKRASELCIYARSVKGCGRREAMKNGGSAVICEREVIEDFHRVFVTHSDALWAESGASSPIYVGDRGAGLPNPKMRFEYPLQAAMEYKHNRGLLAVKPTQTSIAVSSMETMAMFKTAIVGFTGTLPLPGTPELKEEEDAYDLFCGVMRKLPTSHDANGCLPFKKEGPDCNEFSFSIVPSFAASRLHTYRPIVLSRRLAHKYYRKAYLPVPEQSALVEKIRTRGSDNKNVLQLELMAFSAAGVVLYGRDPSTGALFSRQHCILVVCQSRLLADQVASTVTLLWGRSGKTEEEAKKHLFKFTGVMEVDADVMGRAFDAGDVITGPPTVGRGVDWKCKAKGGLLVIAVSHSDSDREQRQVMGRAARAGEPGAYVEVYVNGDLGQVAPERQLKQYLIGEQLVTTLKANMRTEILNAYRNEWPQMLYPGDGQTQKGHQSIMKIAVSFLTARADTLNNLWEALTTGVMEQFTHLDDPAKRREKIRHAKETVCKSGEEFVRELHNNAALGAAAPRVEVKEVCFKLGNKIFGYNPSEEDPLDLNVNLYNLPKEAPQQGLLPDKYALGAFAMGQVRNVLDPRKCNGAKLMMFRRLKMLRLNAMHFCKPFVLISFVGLGEMYTRNELRTASSSKNAEEC
ncbi:unnamed protein product [Amoebophrya sp. A25]|nr:unnamed protein product [Amoebophrya sp. A25]|eukprot:GSA25T00024389001.1